MIREINLDYHILILGYLRLFVFTRTFSRENGKRLNVGELEIDSLYMGKDATQYAYRYCERFFPYNTTVQQPGPRSVSFAPCIGGNWVICLSVGFPSL